MIPFIDLQAQYRALKPDIDGAIQRVLDHGAYIMGPEVAELEEALAAYVGVRHCVTAASGTEALLIALMALDIGAGDEVIVPAFTFAATAEVVLLAGATPVMADVDPETCNIAVEGLAELITERTRAIMPVSLYGQPADLPEINALAERHGIPVIEDAAQSFGSMLGNKRSCGLSAIGCTSFFPSKPLGCYGDGGALFTDDNAIAEASRQIRVHGQSRRYHHTRLGLGGRMDTLQCAIVLAKLKRFDWEVDRRLAIGAEYNRLCDAAGIARVRQKHDRTSVFAQYSVFVEDRPRVQAALQDAGIPTAVHYPSPLSHQPAYADKSRFGPLPRSEWAAQHVMSLPMHPDLDGDVQARIVDTLARVVAA